MAAPAFVDLTAVLRSRAAAVDLLSRLAARTDVHAILRTLGVLATSPSAWLDAERVHVELREHDHGTVVSAFADRDGTREQVLDDVIVAAPLRAIAKTMRVEPELIAPARHRMRGGVLIITTGAAGKTKPPPRMRSGTRKKHGA
ncbi:MAG TPA: hypothetical protein VIF62_22020 [Labilithrix sp.]|jgi:hypothetical protein